MPRFNFDVNITVKADDAEKARTIVEELKTDNGELTIEYLTLEALDDEESEEEDEKET